MITFPLTNRIDVHLSATRYTKHTHGPKEWPWWRLVVPHVARWSDPGGDDSVRSRGYNVWIYTRWCAWCHGFSWPRNAE